MHERVRPRGEVAGRGAITRPPSDQGEPPRQKTAKTAKTENRKDTAQTKERTRVGNQNTSAKAQDAARGKKRKTDRPVGTCRKSRHSRSCPGSDSNPAALRRKTKTSKN